MYSEDEIRGQIAARVPWKIAELNGSAIGYLSYQREDDGRAKISKLYVLPAHQRRGHGQEMLKYISGQARLAGAACFSSA
jgi:ribosomal protein S18 acetylase RimI-like enzyme